MAIIWDDGFFAELDDNRVLVIEGRLSSGKTLLAIELAERYLKRGYRMVSQTSCIWNDDPEKVTIDEQGKLNCVALFDEGGLYFRRSKEAGSVSSFLAKINSYAFFAGRKLPHDDLCSLTCQVWFDFYKWFLIPVKLWRWDVQNGRKHYNGIFVQTSWWMYWGIYDTLDPGDDPRYLVNWFETRTKEFFERYGRKYGLSGVEGDGRDDVNESANEFVSASRNFQSAAQAIRKKSPFGWK